MPTSDIADYDDLLTWSTTNNATNDINFLNSFEVPSGTSPLIIDSATGTGVNVTINGNGFELTLPEGNVYSAYNGLFGLPDAGSTGTFTMNDLGFNFTNTDITDLNGTFFGDATDAGSGYTLAINNCYIIGENARANCGGMLGMYTENFTIDNCYVVINSMSGHNSGVLCCQYASNGTIKNTFSCVDTTFSSKTGGIVGSLATDITVYNCYAYCENNDSSSHSGLIVGSNATDVVIENCYSWGEISGTGSGGICGGFSTNVTIKNCYTVATFNPGKSMQASIAWQLDGTIDNCYATYSTTDVGESGMVGVDTYVTVSNTGYATVEGVWDEDFTYLLNSYTSSDTSQTYTNIWCDDTTFVSPPVEDAPYMLTVFSTDPWNHTTYDNCEGYLASAGGAGDPHINTFKGDDYSFDYLGAFRLFDNNDPDPDSRLIINGNSMHGDSDRWKNKQYIRKMYISYGQSKAYIDMGFRGQRCKIKTNKGFTIHNKELGVKYYSKVHCWNCDHSVLQYKHSKIREHVKESCHTMKLAVRNRLYLTISHGGSNILLFFENVDENNLQPCRFGIFGISNKFLKNATGCLIDRIYSKQCALDDIKNLDDPTVNKISDKDNETTNKIDMLIDELMRNPEASRDNDKFTFTWV